MMIPSLKPLPHHFMQVLQSYQGIEDFEIYVEHRKWEKGVWDWFNEASKDFEFSVMHTVDWVLEASGLKKLLKAIRSDPEAYAVGVSGLTVSDSLIQRIQVKECIEVHGGLCKDYSEVIGLAHCFVRRNSLHETCRDKHFQYMNYLFGEVIEGMQIVKDQAFAVSRGYTLKVIPLSFYPYFDVPSTFDSQEFFSAIQRKFNKEGRI